MFDWDDQQLAGIIWGEADDHIVPYPEESENEPQSVFVRCGNNEANGEHANSKPSDQKPSVTKTKLHRGKPESNGDLSFLASNPDLRCIDVITGKETDHEKGIEISKDQNGDRELGSIIGSSWANIGIFDDLDHMFSNDALDDNASLENTDELWTSSTDAEKPSSLGLDSENWGLEPLGSSSCQFDFNTEYLHNGNQSYASVFENPTDSTCYTPGYTPETLHSSFDEAEIDGTNPNLILEKTGLSVREKTIFEPQADSRKVASKKRLSNKPNKSDEISNGRQPQDLYGTWLPHEINVQQFDHQSVPELSKTHLPSATLDQENMPHQYTCFPYQHLPNPYMTTNSYGNLPDQCASISVLPGADDEHSPALSSEGVSMDKSRDTHIKSQSMTPQEKIEKLRRRQQMRALLAIKKQQQQLSNSVPIADYSTALNSSKEDQALHLSGTDFEAEENMTTIYDPSSSLKQNGSSAISVEVVDHNVEDTVLYQLQDVVTKLDTKTRLYIRDSLFRLAQSAMQRHYSSDPSSANRTGGCEAEILKQNIINQESFIKMPNAETETNSIDRAVAHLLFHQPYNLTTKHTGPSAVSCRFPKTPPGLEMGNSSSMPLRFGSKHCRGEQKISMHGLNTHFFIKEPRKKDSCEQPQQTIEGMNQKMKQKMGGECR